MAVLTSGELAMARATVLGVGVRGGAGDAHLDELGRPLAVADHLQREVEEHRLAAPREGRPRPVASTPEAPVAATSSVSEVEVSLSTVMRLKVRSHGRRDDRLQLGRGRSGRR